MLFSCALLVLLRLSAYHVTCMNVLDQLHADGQVEFVTVLNNSGISSNLTVGNFTVFVPIDATSLCRVNCTDDEIDVILNHVISGVYSYDDLQNDVTLMTLSGYKVRANRYTDNYANAIVTVNGVPVAWHHNVKADNGIIHVIQGVLSLASGDLIFQLSSTVNAHSYVHNLKKTGTDVQFTDKVPGTFTAFVPSNFAFAELGPSLVRIMFHNRTFLLDVLKNHMVKGTWYKEGLTTVSSLTSLNNERLKITGYSYVNGAKITQADIPATNGVIHIIDHVIIPKLYVNPGVIG